MYEQFNRPINSTFDFSEYPDERLLNELSEQMQLRKDVPHRGERLRSIERHIAHLIFEIEYRSGAFQIGDDDGR